MTLRARFGDPVLAASEVVALAALAAVLAGVVALGYRWYARDRVQTGLPVLVGLGSVAVYRGTTTALGQVLNGTPDGTNPLSPETALFNIAVFTSPASLRSGASTSATARARTCSPRQAGANSTGR